MIQYLVHLDRMDSGDRAFQTLGRLTLYRDYEEIFSCATVEPPWLHNHVSTSCVPNGMYTLSKRFSPKFKSHFLIEDVPGRSFILIHAGNYRKDSRGCVIAGREHVDVNGDGHLDVTSSRLTIARMNELLPDESLLLITSEFPL